MRLVGGLFSLMLGVVVVLVAALPVFAAGSVEYQVVSRDVNGNPTAFSDFGSYYTAMQVFAPFSLSSDGGSVAYAKRNGSPTDPGYVPMAANEFCNDNGDCRDIYVHDLATGKTDSVNQYIDWSGDPSSGSWVGFGGGAWAASADHTKFVQNWNCWGDTFGDGTVCDGRIYEQPVVWVDITTGETQVVNVRPDGSMVENVTGWVSPFLLMSADGDTVVFESGGVEVLAPRGQQCLVWACIDPNYGGGIYVWERGQGVQWVTDPGSHFNGLEGDTTVIAQTLSGDGRYIFFVVDATYWEDDGVICCEYSSHVVRYDIDTGVSELVASGVESQFTSVAANHDGSRAVVAGWSLAFGEPGRVWLIDVPTDEVRFVADMDYCSSLSITPDGTVAACDRNNFGPPVIIDLSTGELHDFATAADGFGESGYRGPYIGADGNTAVWAGQRLSDPDHVFGAMQVRVATLTDGPGIPP